MSRPCSSAASSSASPSGSCWAASTSAARSGSSGRRGSRTYRSGSAAMAAIRTRSSWSARTTSRARSSACPSTNDVTSCFWTAAARRSSASPSSVSRMCSRAVRSGMTSPQTMPGTVRAHAPARPASSTRPPRADHSAPLSITAHPCGAQRTGADHTVPETTAVVLGARDSGSGTGPSRSPRRPRGVAPPTGRSCDLSACRVACAADVSAAQRTSARGRTHTVRPVCVRPREGIFLCATRASDTPPPSASTGMRSRRRESWSGVGSVARIGTTGAAACVEGGSSGETDADADKAGEEAGCAVLPRERGRGAAGAAVCLSGRGPAAPRARVDGRRTRRT